jgi:hypothetical protein
MPPMFPMPAQDRVLDERGRFRTVWVIWLQQLLENQNRAAMQVVGPVILEDVTGALAVTPFLTPALRGGLYRVSYYVRIVNPAGTSSSVAVSVGWTDKGVPCQASGAAVTGNTITSTGTGTFLLSADASTPVTYSTTYSSTPAGMRYRLALWLEEVPAS